VRPTRESVRQSDQTYFVSTQTAERYPFFRHERWAKLFLDVVEHYRSGYLLHAYVLMPDHVHLLLSPAESLERSIQNIKGGFSYRAKRELGWQGEVWQKGFTDHRIRDANDFERHIEYIAFNPVRAKLCQRPEEYPYISLLNAARLNDVPPRLKPPEFKDDNVRAEARTLQS
jgi:putative transposase